MFASRARHFLPERSCDLGRPGKKEVAGDDGDEIPPACVHALDLAAHHGLVDHVVVVQRGLVHQLDGYGARQVVFGGLAHTSRGCRDGQCRPEPLTAAVDEVRRNLVQEAVARRDGVEQGGFQTAETILDRGNTKES